jgi:hypothetical protein
MLPSASIEEEDGYITLNQKIGEINRKNKKAI